MKASDHLSQLSAQLGRLPGVGRRTAERMAFRIARDPEGLLAELMEALRGVAEAVRCCSRCGSITTVREDPCALCSDPRRDGSILCVVEDASDILSIEASGGYTGIIGNSMVTLRSGGGLLLAESSSGEPDKGYHGR